MVIEGSSYAISVKGALSEDYASRTVSAGGGVAEAFRASGAYDIQGAATFTGSEVVVEATAKLTLQAGGVTVEMTPSGITIHGPLHGQCNSVQGKESSFG
jgi:phage baseplate assembly protein gpV